MLTILNTEARYCTIICKIRDPKRKQSSVLNVLIKFCWYLNISLCFEDVGTGDFLKKYENNKVEKTKLYQKREYKTKKYFCPQIPNLIPQRYYHPQFLRHPSRNCCTSRVHLYYIYISAITALLLKHT